MQFKPAKVALKYGGRSATDNDSVRKYTLLKDRVLKYSTDEELGDCNRKGGKCNAELLRRDYSLIIQPGKNCSKSSA